jgi:hypothetical protein
MDLPSLLLFLLKVRHRGPSICGAFITSSEQSSFHISSWQEREYLSWSEDILLIFEDKDFDRDAGVLNVDLTACKIILGCALSFSLFPPTSKDVR